MKNWLTTLFGVLAAAGAAAAHYGTGVLSEVGTLVSIVGTALLGSSSADASKKQ